jgi:hypothetical protein
MIYILRLTNGDCVVAMAADERGAHQVAMRITTLDEAPEVATIRRLDTLGIRFSPTEDGSLQVAHWEDATLDNILANEYPLLNEACRRANAEPFLPAANLSEPVLPQLEDAYERNTNIIRDGLQQELQRCAPTKSSVEVKIKAAATQT